MERGHADGLAETQQAASALRDALARFEIECAQVLTEAEGFCVDVALAIVAHLAESDDIRAEFVLRSVKSALKALAPENPTAIFVHPDDHKHLGHALDDLPVRDDDTIAPGSARVEAGRLLVQSSIEEAFEQIRAAVLELKAKRQASARGIADGGIDASNG
jgi:flagellar biosynthesis/type III secretory pathway protein FliH